MLEDHVKSRPACRRLRAGPAEAHVDAFVRSLLTEGYSPATVDQTCHFLAVLTDWMALSVFGDDIAAGLMAYRALAKQGCLQDSESTARRAQRAGKRYLQFLRRQGTVAPAKLLHERRPMLGD